MIGCLRTRVRKQPIIALYFDPEPVLKFYNLQARVHPRKTRPCLTERLLMGRKESNQTKLDIVGSFDVGSKRLDYKTVLMPT